MYTIVLTKVPRNNDIQMYTIESVYDDCFWKIYNYKLW